MEKIGKLLYPAHLADCFLETMDELGLKVSEATLQCVAKKDEDHKKLPACYVVSEGIAYKVSAEEAKFMPGRDKLPDGSVVTFRTPDKKKGKFRWAYNIELAE